MVLAILALSSVAPLASETVEGILIDNKSVGKVKTYDAAKSHTRSAALAANAKKSGYSIITQDGTVVKLDGRGNILAVATLEASDKQKDLRVAADRDLGGGALTTKELRLLHKSGRNSEHPA